VLAELGHVDPEDPEIITHISSRTGPRSPVLLGRLGPMARCCSGAAAVALKRDGCREELTALCSQLLLIGSKPKPTASVPSSSVPTPYVASLTFMPNVTWSGSGSVLMMLPRTLVPSQSMTPATNGTGTPGAANATIVYARSSPSVGTSTARKSVALHLAHALRRSKKRAPQLVHSLATRCGWSPSTR